MAIIIFNNENVAEIFLRLFSFIPRIEGSGPPVYFNPPCIEGGNVPKRVAFSHPFDETQKDLIDSVLDAEGGSNVYTWHDELPSDWVRDD